MWHLPHTAKCSKPQEETFRTLALVWQSAREQFCWAWDCRESPATERQSRCALSEEDTLFQQCWGKSPVLSLSFPCELHWVTASPLLVGHSFTNPSASGMVRVEILKRDQVSAGNWEVVDDILESRRKRMVVKREGEAAACAVCGAMCWEMDCHLDRQKS